MPPIFKCVPFVLLEADVISYVNDVIREEIDGIPSCGHVVRLLVNTFSEILFYFPFRFILDFLIYSFSSFLSRFIVFYFHVFISVFFSSIFVLFEKISISLMIFIGVDSYQFYQQ